MFTVEFTAEAIKDLEVLRPFEQRAVVEAVEAQLKDQPNVQTRNRKPLRPNELAMWELRVGRCRVFYDVDEAKNIVKITAVGVKEGNRLRIRGRDFTL